MSVPTIAGRWPTSGRLLLIGFVVAAAFPPTLAQPPLAGQPQSVAVSPERLSQQGLTVDRATGVDVQECVVRFGQELNLPTSEAGLIAELNVTVGQSIEAGQLVARLDDRSLQIRSRAARLRLMAIEERAADDVELRYAETARDEAQAEWESSRAVYQESSGAVPLSNLRRLRLAVERAELEVSRAHQAARQVQIEADIRAADVALLEDTLRRYSLPSPIDGVVLQVARQQGEWVAVGDTVIRLARLDRLQVQALLAAEDCPPNDGWNRAVTVHWHDPASGSPQTLPGHVTAVLPQRLADGRYRIQAEIVNRRSDDGKAWLLYPGTEVQMTLYPAATVGHQRQPTPTDTQSSPAETPRAAEGQRAAAEEARRR